MTGSPRFAIATDGLTKRYGRFAAVTALDLRVAPGGITGFLGKNGAGKSTTIKMLLGMTHPSAGGGTILGASILDPLANREMRRRVAYVGEDKRLYGYLTVAEMIRFTRSFYSDWRPEVADRLLVEYELPPSRKVRALSKGMRTKLALLQALARAPELLILDEPSEGLDPVAVEDLLQALVRIAADGTTIFFSSHQITEVERIADHVCIIDRGALALELSVDAMRERYRRVIVGFANAPPAVDWADGGAQHVRTSGRQVSMISTRDHEALVQRAKALAAVSIEVAPVGLREIFLDTVADRP